MITDDKMSEVALRGIRILEKKKNRRREFRISISQNDREKQYPRLEFIPQALIECLTNKWVSKVHSDILKRFENPERWSVLCTLYKTRQGSLKRSGYILEITMAEPGME